MKTSTLTFEEKYQAVVDRNASYEGQFIVAVKTTKIFCRPVCTARKPKKENVEFYLTSSEAIQQGYRPCKVCKPLEFAGSVPPNIEALLNKIHEQLPNKVKDEDLRTFGLEPNGVRRWFKKNYGMTFQEYQRMFRLNGAYQNLLSGKSVTHTAFDQGFESLSGFNDGFQKIFGVSPSKSEGKTIIQLIRITTPLGPMFAGATDKGVCILEFTDGTSLEANVKVLRRRMNAIMLPGSNQHLELVRKELAEYFLGSRKAFTFPLSFPGTHFQQQVWEGLQKIPYGETRGYQEQAKFLGNPKAVRAVATANAKNRLAIVIPCHRVIGSDGALRGYAGGLARKRWLLSHEQRHRKTLLADQKVL